MIIQNFPAVSPVTGAGRKGAVTTDDLEITPAAAPVDLVTLSARGRTPDLDMSAPMAVITEERVRMNLVGILLETLFGKDDTTENEDPQEALYRELVEEPAAENALDELVDPS